MILYIDVGAHKGKLIDKFKREIEEKHFCIAFEPNMKFYERLKNKAHVVNPYAAWIESGTKKFYIDDGKGEGSTLDETKQTNIDTSKYVNITTIDFAKYINNYDGYKIVLKMDIEGSEYEVVPHMIEKGAADKVDVFILDLHHNRIARDVSKELKIIEDYFEKRGPKFVLHSRINFKELIYGS